MNKIDKIMVTIEDQIFCKDVLNNIVGFLISMLFILTLPIWIVPHLIYREAKR